MDTSKLGVQNTVLPIWKERPMKRKKKKIPKLYQLTRSPLRKSRRMKTKVELNLQDHSINERLSASYISCKIYMSFII